MAVRGAGGLLATIRGLIFVVPWVAWLFVVDVLISFLLPLKVLAPDLVYDLSSYLAVTVWRSIQIIFERFNGARITYSGDAIPAGESAIVVANHVGWADFYMIQALAIRAGMLSRQRYFAKKQLRNVPFLGWGLWAMGMPMVSRNWLKDQKELQKVFSGIIKRRWPTWLISFSEATRFTPRKYAESQAWCAQNGRPQPKNLLYPRTKGFVTTVKQLRGAAAHVRAVYVLTIAYRHGDKFQGAPTMWQTLSVPRLSDRAGYRFHVNTRRFLIEDLPHGDEELAKWLEEQWLEKGEWLESMKAKASWS